ncbi:protein-ADP-ribose hydrolase [Slackia heliotrinireducens]|uniref:protein-ADP-ribose hydrolase n=1 Tax=Slackia heliotrinireducens TaxID=84110 RepID=UPI003315CFCF
MQHHAEELKQLIHYLSEESGERIPADLDALDSQQLWNTFRGLVNVRVPRRASSGFYAMQDAMLQAIIHEDGVTDAATLPRTTLDQRLSLWQGDITRLRADAIVNAANSQMLGCWTKCHSCIDNVIHTYAGVQLREECDRIMRAQGENEPTGHAKVTGAYNLPSKHVIHTVGPIAQGHPTARHRLQLAQCYTSCLDAAAATGCESIAFCGISTGVYGFPAEQAAPIAVDTVRDWLDRHPDVPMHVVFNVFGNRQLSIYQDILCM